MKHTVLLVDDDPRVTSGLSRALRNEPYQILGAASGEEALQILGARPIDVIVSDEEMPGMRGNVLLRKVSESFPETVRFMLTGKATLENAVEAINNGGISRFFVKPCNTVDLAASIRQALQQRELMVATRKLLRKTQTQSIQLRRLEEQFPDITRVERDEDGAITIEESPGEYQDLMRKILASLEEK